MTATVMAGRWSLSALPIFIYSNDPGSHMTLAHCYAAQSATMPLSPFSFERRLLIETTDR